MQKSAIAYISPNQSHPIVLGSANKSDAATGVCNMAEDIEFRQEAEKEELEGE